MPILVALCASNLVTLVFVLYLIRIVSDGNSAMLSVIADGIGREVDARTSTEIGGEIGCVGDYGQGVGETATFEGWDLRFNFPATWHARLGSDASAEGKKEVRITSQPGTLFRTGGAVVDKQDGMFDRGVQIDMFEIDGGQNPAGEKKTVLLPTVGKGVTVSKIVGECADAGCPAAEYVIAVDGGRRYHATVQVVGDTFGADVAVAEAIITSLRKP